MDKQGKSGPCATDSTLLGKLKLALVVTGFYILEFKTGVRKREKKKQMLEILQEDISVYHMKKV